MARKETVLFSFLLGSGPMQIPSHTSVYISSAGCWTVTANEHRHRKLEVGGQMTKSEVYGEKNISEVQND